MTAVEMANGLRAMAEVIERIPAGKEFPFTVLTGDSAPGAASMLCYIRDLLTSTPKETFTRCDLLVLLEQISCDSELFPCGTGILFWDMEHDAPEESGT